MSKLEKIVADSIRTSFAKQNFLLTFGARLTHLGLGHVEIEAPVSTPSLNQHGFAHAGLAFAIGDTAAGYAAQSHLSTGSDVLTIELKVNYLAPAIGERLRGIGKVVKPGGRITVVSAEVFAIDGNTLTKVALMQGTMLPLAK